MPKDVHEKAMKELDRLGKMSFMSPEATVVRNYLDWLVALPWSKQTKDNGDIQEVERILDEDHFGLKKVKERILEYLAVLKLTGENKGPILCFVGPARRGQDRRSASRSRARWAASSSRMSLGGVRDEAEIRGHRRTYIGSMPGRIVQSAAQGRARATRCSCSTRSTSWAPTSAATPASALLEVLDPEQNHTFNDHYLEVDFDLSQVMFITTANSPVLDPAGAARPHGDRAPAGLPRVREGADREGVPHSQGAEGARARGGGPQDRRRGAADRHRQLHARGGRPEPRARDRGDLPQGREEEGRGAGEGKGQGGQEGAHVPDHRRRTPGRISACRSTSTARSRGGRASAWRPASRGPRSAATC